MAIKKKLPDEFRKNFSDSMFGSEVVYVRKTENPDYCLVYYNSNESDSGLGMVPEEQPVLCDGKGNKLAFDYLDGPQNNGSDHFYVLDDKVVVVSGVSAEERYKPNPVFEMERDEKLYERVLKALSSGLSPAAQKMVWAEVKPFPYEVVLVSILSLHEVSFAQLKDAYTEGLIVHRLEGSGTNVAAACEDSAKELGAAGPFRKFFRKFMDDFLNDFADLLEEGKISHLELDFCLLEDVSKKFPEVYKKVRDSVLDVKAMDATLDWPVVEKPVDSESQAYRDGVISVLQEAYKAARPTNEVVRGNYAREFSGEVTWSRALDFSVAGMPEVKGLRYIDFADGTLTLTRLLMKDGNSKPVNELTKTELGLVRDGLQKALKNRKGIRM